MTTSEMSLTSLISRADERLSTGQLAYVEAFAQDQAHEMVLKLFMDESAQDENITRAFLARRLGKKPEQITRWLAVPGNWTIATMADLLAAMGYMPTFGARRFDELPRGNQYHPAAYVPPFSVGNISGSPVSADFTGHDASTPSVSGSLKFSVILSG